MVIAPPLAPTVAIPEPEPEPELPRCPSVGIDEFMQKACDYVPSTWGMDGFEYSMPMGGDNSAAPIVCDDEPAAMPKPTVPPGSDNHLVSPFYKADNQTTLDDMVFATNQPHS